MWSDKPFSSHPTMFSQSRDGVEGGEEGRRKAGRKKVLKKISASAKVFIKILDK